MEQIVVDIDGTLTTDTHNIPDFFNKSPNEIKKIFRKGTPNTKVINKVNELSEKYVICLWTSRADVYQNVTIEWLKKHNVKYDWVMMGKPGGKYYVDDKAIRPDETFMVQ